MQVESLGPSLVIHIDSSFSRHCRNGAFEEMRGCLVPAIETKQIGTRELVDRIGESCSGNFRSFVSLVSYYSKRINIVSSGRPLCILVSLG